MWLAQIAGIKKSVWYTVYRTIEEERIKKTDGNRSLSSSVAGRGYGQSRLAILGPWGGHSSLSSCWGGRGPCEGRGPLASFVSLPG